jgi:hypothetical protein
MPANKKLTTHQHINQIWEQFRDAVDAAYADAQTKDFSGGAHDESSCLRDYARNISWSDDVEKLLATETANERQHRHTRTVRGFSSQDAAKLIICGNVLRGSELSAIPSALTFITFRPSAAEANLLGYLIRAHVTPEWKESVKSLDYSACMKSSEVPNV